MHADLHTVLAATDLSRPAFAAVRRAALIARAHDTKLELLHVIPDLFRSDVWKQLSTAFSQTEAELRSSIAESLAALVAQIEAETGVKANALVTEGKPFAQIAARSEAIDAGLIVVGAHGENLVTPLLGTTAHRVLRSARKPVLLVKQTPSMEPVAKAGYAHIVAATDFSDDSLCAATSARRLFPQSDITLFHAYLAPFEAKLAGRITEEALQEHRRHAMEKAHRDLESFAAAANLVGAPRVVRHGSPAIRLREYAEGTSADLIAVGSEEVARLQNALLGSVSLDTVTQAHCDVLLARSVPA
jgi:universal stress protein E